MDFLFCGWDEKGGSELAHQCAANVDGSDEGSFRRHPGMCELQRSARVPANPPQNSSSVRMEFFVLSRSEQTFCYNQRMKYSKILIAVSLLIGLLSGVILEKYLLTRDFNYELTQIYPLRETDTNYTFISPLLAYNTPNIEVVNKELKKSLESYIDKQIHADQLVNASVFFRDLNSSQTLEINQDEYYTPASLLKVPLMMTYFKIAETLPDLLNDKLTNVNSDNENKNESIKSSKFAEANKEYSVRELIDLMIKYSDNNATLMLFEGGGKKAEDAFVKVFSDLRVQTLASDKYFIKVADYAFFFRILYNSTYLNREMSNNALNLLNQTEFSDGIVAGIPKEVAVAHKFGEYNLIDNNKVTNQQLHDCGIVYYPKKPYILCVMTKGKDINTLKDIIKNISQKTYLEVSK